MAHDPRPLVLIDPPIPRARRVASGGYLSPTMTFRTSSCSRGRSRALAIAAACVALAACGDVPRAFGPTPAVARSNADAMFTALVGRFTNVVRVPRYERAREMLGRFALTPSAIYDDSTVWTAFGPDGTRTLFGAAAITDGRYVFTNVPTNAPLDALGDGRHVMRLHRISGDEYDWFTGVDFAMGHITAADMANVVNRWLAATEGHDGAALRAEAIAAFPRTAATGGRLFAIDTVISTRDADGANALYVQLHLTPDGIRAQLPNYAEYLDKYIQKVKLRFTLADAGGVPWVEGASSDGRFTLRLRTRGGHFAPITGAPRPMPDTLTIKLDMTAKIKLFTIGVQHLTGEWVNVETPHERGWSLRFTQEPDWVLPPVVGHLIRTSLRRPFQGDGTRFRIGIRDEPGAQTLLTRRGTTAVQESAILRFVGKLGGTAVSDFVSKAEEEENRFDAQFFAAMKSDVDAALR
jgi:hypothetical protein